MGSGRRKGGRVTRCESSADNGDTTRCCGSRGRARTGAESRHGCGGNGFINRCIHNGSGQVLAEAGHDGCGCVLRVNTKHSPDTRRERFGNGASQRAWCTTKPTEGCQRPWPATSAAGTASRRRRSA